MNFTFPSDPEFAMQMMVDQLRSGATEMTDLDLLLRFNILVLEIRTRFPEQYKQIVNGFMDQVEIAKTELDAESFRRIIGGFNAN